MKYSNKNIPNYVILAFSEGGTKIISASDRKREEAKDSDSDKESWKNVRKHIAVVFV